MSEGKIINVDISSSKKYYLKNKDKILQKAKLKYKIDREKIREKQKIYNFKNKDKFKIRDREYYLNNRDKRLEYTRKYNIINFEEIRIKRLYYQRNVRDKNKHNLQNKIYCNNNRDKVRKSNNESYKKFQANRLTNSREYYQNNKKKHANIVKKYYLKNKDKIQKYVDNWNNIRKEIENKRRIELGLPQIGEGFMHEQELYVIVKSLFSNYRVERRNRKILGDRLELDIYIPDIKLAFEYNGKQHYDKKTFDAINRNKYPFEKMVYHDEKKKILCSEKNIKLVIVKYDEKMSLDLIKNKLTELN